MGESSTVVSVYTTSFWKRLTDGKVLDLSKFKAFVAGREVQIW